MLALGGQAYQRIPDSDIELINPGKTSHVQIFKKSREVTNFPVFTIDK